MSLKKVLSILFLLPIIVLAQNVLTNGSFDRPILTANVDIEPPAPDGFIDTRKNWIFFPNSGGEGKAYVENGVLVVQITSGGFHTWSVQIIQSPITVEKYHKYRVSFKAKASSERNIAVKIGGIATRGWPAYNPGTDESGGMVFNLSTDWQTYEFEFVMRQETDPKARFEFQLGRTVGTVWIDDVVMEEVGVVEVSEPGVRKRKVKEWKLVWSQEFDEGFIDDGVWNFEIGNGHAKGIPGWGNAELQYYTKENAFIENGCLVIEARKETVSDEYGTYDYTSARMTSEGKFEIQYGKIEIRAKLPKGQGV